MIFKMMHNDKLTKAGIFSFLIMPLILLVIGYMLADLLLPWFMNALNLFLTDALSNLN